MSKTSKKTTLPCNWNGMDVTGPDEPVSDKADQSTDDKCLMDDIHPDISCWQLDLLNEHSHNMMLAREWDESFGFTLKLKTKFSQWVTPKPGEQMVFVSDCVVDVWRFDTRKQIDEMINMLMKVRNEIDFDEEPNNE